MPFYSWSQECLISHMHACERCSCSGYMSLPLLCSTPQTSMMVRKTPVGPQAHPEVWVPLHCTHTVTPSGSSLHPHPLTSAEAAWVGANKVFTSALIHPHKRSLSSTLCFIHTPFHTNVFVSKGSVQLPGYHLIQQTVVFPLQHAALCTVRVLDPHIGVHTRIIYSHISVVSAIVVQAICHGNHGPCEHNRAWWHNLSFPSEQYKCLRIQWLCNSKCWQCAFFLCDIYCFTNIFSPRTKLNNSRLISLF